MFSSYRALPTTELSTLRVRRNTMAACVFPINVRHNERPRSGQESERRWVHRRRSAGPRHFDAPTLFRNSQRPRLLSSTTFGYRPCKQNDCPAIRRGRNPWLVLEKAKNCGPEMKLKYHSILSIQSFI